MNSSFGPLFHPYVASSAYISASGRQSRFASHRLLVSSQRCHICSSSSRGYAGTSALLEGQRVGWAIAHRGTHLVGELGRRGRVKDADLSVVAEHEHLRRLDGAFRMPLAKLVVRGDLHVARVR